MNAISPLTGAVVYNRDEEALYYFVADSWYRVSGAASRDLRFINNNDGTFTIVYGDGSTFQSQDLTGPAGPAGEKGEPGDPATDDQQITDFSLDGNILTLTLENGGTQTVDLSGYVSTDNQDLTGATLTGTNLQIDIEDGSATTVDLAALVDDADADATNELNTGISFDGTNLTVSDAGGNQSVDISGVSTDDQTLGLAGNTLTLENGGAVDLSTYLDNTDDQQITDFSLAGNILTLTLENGGTQTVDLSGYVSTDNQDLTGATLTGTNLQIDIEDGSATTVDLAALVDDADADATNELNTGISFDGTNLTVSDAGGNHSVDISGVSTDDQTLGLAGNTLTLENGGTVDLSPYLDNTDDQNLTGASLTGTSLEIEIEDGSSATVDLAGLVDDADADATNELNTGISFDGTNLTVSDAGGNQSVDISGVSTDDQTLGLAGNTLTLENGGTVDLSSYLDNTDSQDLEAVLNQGNNAAGNQISNLANPTAAQDATTKDYVDNLPRVYMGVFQITSSGLQSITGIPFQPSSISFQAHANVDSFNLNADNGIRNNERGLENSYGSMNGFVQDTGSGLNQQVIYVGGHGNSINDISRYASNSHCIGLRYGNQNGDNLGLTTARVTSLNSDGFTVEADQFADGVIVMFQAYR